MPFYKSLIDLHRKKIRFCSVLFRSACRSNFYLSSFRFYLTLKNCNSHSGKRKQIIFVFVVEVTLNGAGAAWCSGNLTSFDIDSARQQQQRQQQITDIIERSAQISCSAAVMQTQHFNIRLSTCLNCAQLALVERFHNFPLQSRAS